MAEEVIDIFCDREKNAKNDTELRIERIIEREG